MLCTKHEYDLDGIINKYLGLKDLMISGISAQ